MIDTARLNHGGSSPDNPVVSGTSLTIRLAKQGAEEALRQCWVVSEGAVFSKLTGIASSTEFEITVPVVAGTHLKSGSTSKKNVVHFTTSEHRHAQAIVYCVDQPAAMITLDGYDGSDFLKPLIYPLLQE